MKTLKNIKYFFVCFVVLIFELTIGKYLEISGIVPMLSFCTCLVIASEEENVNYIITVSIIMGVFMDLFSGHGFGSYTVSFVLSSWITYNLRNNIFSSKILFLIFDTFTLSLLFSILYYILHILNVGGSFGLMITSNAFPTSTYNTFISLILYWILRPILYKRR